MVPVLTVLLRGQAHMRDLLAEVSDAVSLSDADRIRMLPSGRVTQARSRVSWAVQYLLQAGAIDRVLRRVYAINNRGRTCYEITRTGSPTLTYAASPSTRRTRTAAVQRQVTVQPWIRQTQPKPRRFRHYPLSGNRTC